MCLSIVGGLIRRKVGGTDIRLVEGGTVGRTQEYGCRRVLTTSGTERYVNCLSVSGEHSLLVVASGSSRPTLTGARERVTLLVDVVGEEVVGRTWLLYKVFG